MAWRRTYDGAEPQRVNKWLAQNGVCSRREAEALIGQGLISIEGETISDVGRKIAPGQTLSIADTGAALLENALTVVIHKPVGLVSSQPEGEQIPAARLLTRENLHGAASVMPRGNQHLAPLGRLDQDSRGLLLLSEDGVLAKALIGPESTLDKEYHVCVVGEVTAQKLALLRHGLALDGRQLRPAEVEAMSPMNLRFILREGRNRQIRRMCELVELGVVDLLRTRIGPLTLGDLPEGKWRPLRPAERAALIGA
ncbi:MAG TPA: pseudouridine synthase [Caulobacterales bacterium]|nr:pseudouridine synthase [Caulobacterales bacterium]